MRLGGAGLLAAVLALAGCKSTADSRSKEREPSGIAAARKRGKETKDTKAPAWLNSVAQGSAAGTDIPRGGSWNHDPRQPELRCQDRGAGRPWRQGHRFLRPGQEGHLHSGQGRERSSRHGSHRNRNQR